MSSDQSSDSQSSGGGRKQRKQSKPHAIPFTLHTHTLDHNLRLGRFFLEMPSNLEVSLFKKSDYPSILFEKKDDDQRESLLMMKTLSHQNVLHLYAMEEDQDKTTIQAYVESYTRELSSLLFTWINFVVNGNTSLVPSVCFQGLVSEIVDGLDYIRENGYYHGNFSWDTTFYYSEKDKKIAKLANFERKESKPLLECQVEDWVSLGVALEEVSEVVNRKYPNVHQSTCCLIDDLSGILKAVTPQSLNTIKQDIQDHPFFWDERRRKSFFAIEVPAAWNRPTFETHFMNSLSVPAMPWTSFRYDGYMAEMEAYRAREGIPKYDPENWKDFLRCICGMYTHQVELQRLACTIDSAVQSQHPRLIFDLKAAMAMEQ